MDRRNDQFRKPLKPRCAEPNFKGMAVLQGVNDSGFNHENIRIALHPSFAPPFYCVCGRSSFHAKCIQTDKYHFPTIELACVCGRSKTIIVFAKRIDLTGAWQTVKGRKNEYDLPLDTVSVYGGGIVCRCGKQSHRIFFEQRGFSFYPGEGETILLQCSRCNKYKKIMVRANIDCTEPWMNADTKQRKDSIVVQHDPDACPDSRLPGEEETIFVVCPKEEYHKK